VHRNVGDKNVGGYISARRNAWARYGVAIASVVLGWLMREALTPGVGPTALPFIFFFPAVAIAAWFGGLGPGLLAVALSALAAIGFFARPTHAPSIDSRYDVLAFVAFLLASLLIVGVTQALHLAQRRLANEIAERKRAEVELVEAHDLLAATVASIGDAVILTDEKGNVTFLNPEAERLTGWKDSEAKGQALLNVFHIVNEPGRQPGENPAEKVLRTGKVSELANHTLLISRDGTETPIDDSAAPICHVDGPLFGVVLVFRDVTGQRNAQQAASRLAAVVEQSGDAILTKNLDGVIQTWNPGAGRLFGYRAEEIVGRHVTALFPPDRLNEEDHIIGRLRQGEPVERLQTVRVAKDGRRIPVLVSVSPLKDAGGEIVGASKIIHDISDIVAAREALAREKELLATTLASIGDAVIVTDAEGLVTYVNAEAERLTKWNLADAVSQPLPAIFRIINEETRAPVEDPVKKVLRLGGIVGLANHTVLIAKDGTEIPIDDSAAPIRQAGGPLFGVVLVFRDFTERKNAEEALRDAQRKLSLHAADLEATVAERTAKLKETVNDLQSFSYSIAHDMRAPLRAMGTFAQLLMDEVPAVSASPEAKTYCERIMIGAERLDNLINDALNYSKAVLQELPVQAVDLSKLVRGLLDTYPNLHAHAADIQIDGNLPIVLGNESLLTQCLSNLLGNAVKFVPPGARPTVRLWSDIKDGLARIWVEDQGIGIPKHAQPRLFRMFQKLDNQYEGTGIGLAIVRKAVERMGGNVGVKSEPGRGSRFWVELRVAPKEENA
jgi:PAS domain S-box-containing protein